MQINRRDFIKKTAIAGAGIAVSPSLYFANGFADSKLRVGFICAGKENLMIG